MRYRSYVALASGALCMVTLRVGDAKAFFPHAYLSGYGALGRSHQTITETSIKDVVMSVYGLKPTRGVSSAIEEIVEGNAAVDKDQFQSRKHFDGENFSGGQGWILEQRADCIAALGVSNVGRARESLGHALHTLQDFYSHSNWVELGSGGPQPQLGKVGGTISAISPAGEATCVDCKRRFAPVCNDCSATLVTSQLTSGYYGGEDRSKPVPDKCSHGGFFDGEAPDPGVLSLTYGINKDSLDCLFSPRHDLHTRAADVAIQATKQFLLELRADLTDAQYRQLLGLGPTLAVAMDTTMSMQPIIDQVQAEATAIANGREGSVEAPSRFVYVPFGDPTIGPAVVTANSAEFSTAINKSEAGGGGDCPELSMGGTQMAVRHSLNGGQVFLFTDATAKDQNLAETVAIQAAARDMKIYPSLFGSCSPYDPAYFHLAEQTGGQVFIITDEEAGAVTDLIDAVARLNQVSLGRTSSVSTVAAESVFDVLVDSTLTALTFSVSGSRPYQIVKPDGSSPVAGDPQVQQTMLSSGQVVRISAPAAGTWRVVTSGVGESTTVLVGESELSLDSFRFVELGGRPAHQGFYPIDGAPLAGTMQDAVVHLRGPVMTAVLELRDAVGQLIGEHPLETTADAPEHYLARLVPPTVPFYVYVAGVTSSGEPFRRALERRFQAQYLDIAAPLGESAARGQALEYTFTLKNMGAADDFTVTASDDLGFLRTTPDPRLRLEAGAEATIRVGLKVAESAEYGSTDSLTLVIKSKTHPELVTYGLVDTQVSEDTDRDDDLLSDVADNCPTDKNPEQIDADLDGVGDACDACPGDKQTSALVDTDGDGKADGCPKKRGEGCSAAPGTGGTGALAGFFLVALSMLGLRRWRMRRATH